jgi:hypothetical protein
MKAILLFALMISFLIDWGQITPFEKSKGKETATYFECIDFYKKLAGNASKISLKQMGMSDAGYPLHLVLYSSDGQFDPRVWHRQHKILITGFIPESRTALMRA